MAVEGAHSYARGLYGLNAMAEPKTQTDLSLESLQISDNAAGGEKSEDEVPPTMEPAARPFKTEAGWQQDEKFAVGESSGTSVPENTSTSASGAQQVSKNIDYSVLKKKFWNLDLKKLKVEGCSVNFWQFLLVQDEPNITEFWQGIIGDAPYQLVKNSGSKDKVLEAAINWWKDHQKDIPQTWDVLFSRLETHFPTKLDQIGTYKDQQAKKLAGKR
ncbi:hypothetical protein D5018_09140 [Parashewanella curva]|uniref:Uncharacterized protein n=1 Tax=Parashewanella curva TaxID=2338552 RepID=A0A3L8Q0P9_9GAMM|nr:hypothetical protein [Parashewanella curva]RLV59962.1 hypothetical protein D5018_09140 [Parashewanella curva]